MPGSSRARHEVRPAGLGQVAPPAPGEGARCPDGTVWIHGEYCPDAREDCLEWSPVGYERCMRFRSPTRCGGRRRAMSFCMDRYEWPNRAGARPEVMVTWVEAERACHAAGRRLCTEDEWTFACEGEAMLPYPYGYTRDATACNIDQAGRRVDRARVGSGNRATAMAEVARVNTSRPSGAAPRCVSPFGVYDLTGNVDEWTVSRTGRPYRSALKGGWWGWVRTRCRPVTRSHFEHFRYYQIGFRCCAAAR